MSANDPEGQKAVKKAYLPGIGVTVISKAVPPGRGSSIALWVGLTPAIIPHVDNSYAQFLVAGKCVRAHPDFNLLIISISYLKRKSDSIRTN